MANSKNIAHKGLIRSIVNGQAEVSLIDAVGCTSCAVKSTCGAAASSNKIIEVPVKAGTFSVGEIVELEMPYKQGVMALIWAYLIPFALLLIALISCLLAGFTEGQAAVSTLALLPVYYGLLYLFNNVLSRKFQFKISKT